MSDGWDDDQYEMEQTPDQIDALVDRLNAALTAAGYPTTKTPLGPETQLTAVASAIAPFKLPRDVEQFWRRVDPQSLAVTAFPRLIGPEFALDTWVSHIEEIPGQLPRLLFPVAYDSHCFLFVELDDGAGSEGVVVSWGYAGSPFAVAFPNFRACLDLFVTMIEIEEFDRHSFEGRSWAYIDGQRWNDAAAVRLAQALPLSRFGTRIEFEEDIDEWPRHWLDSNGVTEEVRAPRGPTATIAELLDASVGTDTPVTGTVHGLVTFLTGNGSGCRVTISDGTGELDVWCPAAVTMFGPTMSQTFEFDVVVRPEAPSPPDAKFLACDIQEAALSHDLEAAQALGMEFFEAMFADTSAAAAEATAIRRLS